MKIIVKNQKEKVSKELIDLCHGNEILAKIFFNRGIRTKEDFENQINNDKYIPFEPLNFPKMDLACSIIRESINSNEKIAVYGDYDVDGVTATSILVSALSSFGANVVYHVPDRFSEGYGMNLEVVRKMYDEGVKLIITCDCGIANFDEIKLAKELNMRVVLTDHHTIGDELPRADVIINPKLLPEGHKIRYVSGCAVAFFVVQALSKVLGKETDDYSDLVALSIIADVIPLRDEGRFLFKKGLPKLLSGERVGLGALINLIPQPVKTAEDIGFQISPRINAVGRLASAKIAVELFLTKDKEKAKELATEIDRYNTDRKNIQTAIYDQAVIQVEEKKKNKKILVLYNESWHHGVLGIVAGKISEEYCKPCIILSLTEDGSSIVGSARSTANVNIYETLKIMSEDLIKFGGHAQAAGLSLKPHNLEKFTSDIETYADLYIDGSIEESVFVDMILPFSMINEDLLEELKLGEPYGMDFEAPVFVSENVRIQNDVINGNKHHFLTLMDSSKTTIGCTLWNFGPDSVLNKDCTIVYSIYKDMYKERNEIKIKPEKLIFDKVDLSDNISLLIDRRNVPVEEVIKEFKGAAVFYEGPVTYKPNLPVIGSDFDEKIGTLILYSLPRSNTILKRLMEKSCPDKIVINYSYLPNYNIETFGRMFLGLIKNAVDNYGGVLSVPKIAKTMLIEEEFVYTFCSFLKNRGMIEFNMISVQEIKFEIKRAPEKSDSTLYQTVVKYLKEKEDYAKYAMETVI